MTVGSTVLYDGMIDEPEVAYLSNSPSRHQPSRFERCSRRAASTDPLLGSMRSVQPALEPVLLEGDLGEVPLPSRPAEPYLRPLLGVEVACCVRGDTVAHLDEARSLALEDPGWWATGELGGDPLCHHLRLRVGEDPCLWQEFAAGERDRRDVADREHALRVRRERRPMNRDEAVLAGEGAVADRCRCPVRWDAEQKIAAHALAA